jgi:glycosyltransferase involved in cell wall biosynthesis
VTPTLTIAVPTIGRPTLADTLASIARQALIPGDQVLIVFDSFACDRAHRDATRDLVERYGFTFVAHDGGEHFYGNPQLNRAIELATGDYFCALGDDDVYVDGAFARMRKALKPGRALLYQFYAPPDLVPGKPGLRVRLWHDRTLRVANISGCCITAPRASLVPVSRERRIEVDYEWIVDIVAKTGQKPVWLRDCLIIARPDLRDGQTVHAGVADCLGCGAMGFVEDMDGGLCADCAPVVIRELLGVA